jgi:DNA-binding transcriptional LysR family regulator
LDIRFLESLLAVIDTGSIAAAARRQNLTPAAISQRVQALEKQFGTQLLARNAHSARPTEACLALMPRMRRLTAEAQALSEDLDTAHLGGELTVGAISTALTGMMPAALKQFTETAPGIRLKISPGASDRLYEAVLSGEMDGAVLVQPPFAMPKSVSRILLRRERLIFLSPEPADHLPLENVIEAAPYIRYDPGSWGGRMAARFIEDRALQPEIFCDLDGLEAIAILVASGIGNSLVPAWAGFRPEGLCVTEVDTDRRYNREIVFLHASLPRRPKALDLFKQALVAAVERTGRHD